ncbi:MAG: glycosyl hydrolase, partial [Massilia sp.]|nr:glycosyl hydrolase [Massilia sp.]
MKMKQMQLALTLAFTTGLTFTLPAALAATPDERAAGIVARMTMAEKIQTVFGYFSTDFNGVARPKEGVPQAAGFVYGVERLGVPHQQLTDAGVGVATQRGGELRARTSLPSGIATAATWNPGLAFAGGAMIGKEARL